MGVACQCDKMLAASISLVAIALFFASRISVFFFYFDGWADALKCVAVRKKIKVSYLKEAKKTQKNKWGGGQNMEVHNECPLCSGKTRRLYLICMRRGRVMWM